MSVDKVRYVIQQDIGSFPRFTNDDNREHGSPDYWEVIDLEVIDVSLGCSGGEPTVVKGPLTEQLAQRHADRLNTGEIICECGKTGQSDHTCPYKEERDDDFVSLCNCCKECEQECFIAEDE